jgi:nitrogen fixation/metabolism regulation signal transduction histidine kinase
VTQFDVMTGQFDQITKLVEEVADPAADAGVEALRQLIKGTFDAGNFQAAAIVGQAQETFLFARISADNYIDNSEDGAVEKVAESLAQLDGYAKQLSASLSVATNRALLDEAVAKAATFKAAFDEAAKLTAESDKILQETLLPTLDQIGDVSDKMKSAAAEAQQVNRGEVAEGISAARLTTIIVAAVAVLMGLANAFLIVRSVAGPIKGMTGAMTELAGGNKQAEIPGRDRGDEIGAMAAAVLVFKENMIKAERLQAEQEETKKRTEAERRQMMLDLADKFEASVGHVVDSVTSAATELQATAQSLSATAEETSQQSNAVAAAAEQMSQNVQTVASATEELSSSIREIGNQVTESTRIVGTAVTQADDTNAKVKTLAEAAQRIGAVIGLINEIASQTNLLALNARSRRRAPAMPARALRSSPPRSSRSPTRPRRRPRRSAARSTAFSRRPETRCDRSTASPASSAA